MAWSPLADRAGRRPKNYTEWAPNPLLNHQFFLVGLPLLATIKTSMLCFQYDE